MALTLIPILGLVGLGLAVFYHPNELVAVVLKAVYGEESDVGPEDVERAPLVV